ncbi:MAG: hypothetical protein R3191_02645, partial [Anaerolineales bacterium]|nr:hypothetical protein [Anaerolineales bacterium]
MSNHTSRNVMIALPFCVLIAAVSCAGDFVGPDSVQEVAPPGADEPVFDPEADFLMFNEDWESYATASEILTAEGDND